MIVMAMSIIARLECDKCSSHRDLEVGNLDDLTGYGGLAMIVRCRAMAIGWKIHCVNGVNLTECSRCKPKEQ